jgi:hypothetical protein
LCICPFDYEHERTTVDDDLVKLPVNGLCLDEINDSIVGAFVVNDRTMFNDERSLHVRVDPLFVGDRRRKTCVDNTRRVHRNVNIDQCTFVVFSGFSRCRSSTTHCCTLIVCRRMNDGRAVSTASTTDDARLDSSACECCLVETRTTFEHVARVYSARMSHDKRVCRRSSIDT